MRHERPAARSSPAVATHGGRRDQTPRVLLRPHRLVFYESDGTVTIAPRLPPLAGVLLTTNLSSWLPMAGAAPPSRCLRATIHTIPRKFKGISNESQKYNARGCYRRSMSSYQRLCIADFWCAGHSTATQVRNGDAADIAGKVIRGLRGPSSHRDRYYDRRRD